MQQMDTPSNDRADEREGLVAALADQRQQLIGAVVELRQREDALLTYLAFGVAFDRLADPARRPRVAGLREPEQGLAAAFALARFARHVRERCTGRGKVDSESLGMVVVVVG